MVEGRPCFAGVVKRVLVCVEGLFFSFHSLGRKKPSVLLTVYIFYLKYKYGVDFNMIRFLNLFNSEV